MVFTDTKQDNVSTASGRLTAAEYNSLVDWLTSIASTAASVLTLIKTVDGSGSNLDADLLDGHSSAYFATQTDMDAAEAWFQSIPSTAANLLTSIKTVDGSGSGLDADTLDAHETTYFATDADMTAAEAWFQSIPSTAANILTAVKTVDGTGSGLDADLLDGHETTYFSVSGHSHLSVKSKTSGYTAVAGDVVLANASGGAFSITLPLNPSTGSFVIIKKVDASINAVTVNGNGDTIDGAATVDIVNQYESLTCISDGTSWYLI